MNIRSKFRHVASAAAALVISTFFITAAVGPAISPAGSVAGVEAAQSVA